MNRSLVLPVTAVLLTVLTGCAGGGEEPDPDGAPGGIVVVSNADPVDVLRKVPGCVLAPGAITPETDENGNGFATCELSEATVGRADSPDVSAPTVLVRAVDPAAIEPLGYGDAAVDDSTKVVFGEDFYLTVSAEPVAFAGGAIDMEAIAAAVGGEVVE